jgi:hypothetical protein
LVSTHSEVLLSNPGIDGRGVVVLETSPEGTQARTLREDEAMAINDGLSIAEVVLPKTRPAKAAELGQLKLWP